jgi:hypothetical protein
MIFLNPVFKFSYVTIPLLSWYTRNIKMLLDELIHNYVKTQWWQIDMNILGWISSYAVMQHAG